MNINRDNYESFFLLYLDRELKPTEVQEVERFINENADVQKEFALLQQAVCSPTENIVFQKELLYRTEEKRRITPFYWMRIAATVLFILAGGWFILKEVKKGVTDKINRPLVVTVKNSADAIVQQNNLSARNQDQQNSESPGKIANKKTVPHSDQGITHLNNQQTNKISDEPLIAKQKSRFPELQSAVKDPRNEAKKFAVVAKPSAVSLTATDQKDLIKDEYAGLKEPDNHSEYAISVVALNDRNGAITGFFKKLTKRAPVNENTKKVQISVFQFSY